MLPVAGLEKNPEFVAPEVLSSKPSEKSDVYSLGKVLDLLLKSSNDLVKNMCSKNENQRFSLDQVASHPWLNDNFVVTIRCLENILSSGQAQQVSLLKGLQNIITQFDVQIVKDRILPAINQCLRVKYSN